LKVKKTKAASLKAAVVEATYAKLITKAKKHIIFKVMNLLE
jgi:hypothetical protein